MAEEGLDGNSREGTVQPTGVVCGDIHDAWIVFRGFSPGLRPFRAFSLTTLPRSVILSLHISWGIFMASEPSHLSSAMEDYLEAIYHLEQEQRIARVRDIARRLDVKMSSVTSALKSLGSRGLIQYDPHQFITLTAEGLEQAREIVRKHEVLKRFFVRVLRVEGSAAEDNACRIEHHLDPEVIEKLVGFVEFVEMCPVDQTRWIEGVSEGCDDCSSCLDEAKKLVRTRAQVQRAAVEGGLTLGQGPRGCSSGLAGPDRRSERIC